MHRQHAMSTALIILSVMLLSGCAEDVRLRHPVTGQMTTCKAPVFDGPRAQRSCVEDYQRADLERTP